MRLFPVLLERLAGVWQLLQSPKGVRVSRACGWLAVLAVLVWYLALMAGRMGVYAGGSDSSGYANNARLIMAGRLFAEQRRIDGVTGPLPPYTHVPLGFAPSGEGRMVPTYPLGLSALFVAASFGTSLNTGMTLAMGLMLIGSLFATYALARRSGLGRGWAALCVGILAACPLFQGMSLQAMSDMPALLWTTLALVLGLAARERRWLAGVAGIVVSVAVFVRPSNVLVLVPMLWALGVDWRRWLWLALGGAPGAAVWMLTNHALFGRYVATGYGDVSTLFAWCNVGPTLRNYATTLPQLLPLFFLSAFAVCGTRRGDSARVAAGMAAMWVLILAAFYSFYACTQETWWYLRFVLPAFPALIVLSVCGLRQVCRWVEGTVPGWRTLAACATVALALGIGLKVQLAASAKWSAMEFGICERAYPRLCARVGEMVPPDAVIFCMQTSGALFYSGPWTVVRWDLVDKTTARSLMTVAAKTGRPVYAVLFPFELDEEHCFRRGLAGRWSKVATVDDNSIWLLEDAAGDME
jgi:hypothetical protein